MRYRLRGTDPVAVVWRREKDGIFREVRRYNPWLKPLLPGGEALPPITDTPEQFGVSLIRSVQNFFCKGRRFGELDQLAVWP